MKFLLAPARILYCLYALILFILLMLMVIPFAAAASFFGKIRGGNLIYKMCTLWADVWLFLIGIYHNNIYEVPHNKQRQYIFVSNHISYLDAPIIVKTIRQRVRILGKAEMAHIPLFGFIYRNAIITVDRGNAANRANSVRILKSILKKSISIFMFPEGTFNETHQPLKDFYDGAFRIAIEMQIPIKPVLMLDAYERMHYHSLISLSPGISRSVFLDEISVEGLKLKDIGMLKEKVYSIMERALIKYNASWIHENLAVNEEV
jgi:1-acyl-sn-glycerol-3-phosphate acyltransferase